MYQYNDILFNKFHCNFQAIPRKSPLWLSFLLVWIKDEKSGKTRRKEGNKFWLSPHEWIITQHTLGLIKVCLFYLSTVCKTQTRARKEGILIDHLKKADAENWLLRLSCFIWQWMTSITWYNKHLPLCIIYYCAGLEHA